jgi:tRNA C32,U32 (ribose-2'-O)-methylase TrmJ
MGVKRMILQLGDDGVVSKVNEEDLIYVDKNELDELVDRYNRLKEENEQVQARNDRQAKQLDNLYTLIEKQDWKTLKGIIQEFQECEEQLKKEWANSGDVE